MWSSCHQALQARCLTSARATPFRMMSLKLTLPVSPNCWFRASRASAARSMSTSDVRKKCGTGPSDAANRLAIVLRICVRGTSSNAAPLAITTGAGAAEAETARTGAASRSRRITRPPGPEPCSNLRSTPFSLAIRLASGEALTTRVASATATGAGAVDGAGAAGAGAAATGVGAGATGGEEGGAAAETFSPGAPMNPTISPTGTVAPSATTCCNSWPSARATSSITALSVSTSASVSPVFTGSPTALVHLTRRPSSIVGERASMTTLVGIVSRGRGRAARPRPPSRAWAWPGARAACYRASARRPA